MSESNHEDLFSAVDRVFQAYDTDKSGFLDREEVLTLIGDAMDYMKLGKRASQE